MALNITKEVAAMQRMTGRELKRKFEEVFGEACRSSHKQALIKRIAWRQQANAEGDLSERARHRATELANDADLRMQAPAWHGQKGHASIARSHDSRIPMPGTVLSREYKGETVQVTVLPGGFDYGGAVYSSLSAAAKAITGSHTSGFLFFRLNGKGGRKWRIAPVARNRKPSAVPSTRASRPTRAWTKTSTVSTRNVNRPKRTSPA